MNQKSFFKGQRNENESNFMLFGGKSSEWKSFPQAFFPILGLMARDSNFNVRVCSGVNKNLSIETSYRGQQGSLYLRYNYGRDDRLVVASVQFIHRRKGNMTELFSILKQIRRAYHTGPIMIESVLTDEMASWCKKNGFVVDPICQNNYIWPPSSAHLLADPDLAKTEREPMTETSISDNEMAIRVFASRRKIADALKARYSDTKGYHLIDCVDCGEKDSMIVFQDQYDLKAKCLKCSTSFFQQGW